MTKPFESQKEAQTAEQPMPLQPPAETSADPLHSCRSRLEVLLARLEELTRQPDLLCSGKAAAAPPEEQSLALVCRLLEDPAFLAARLHALYCRKLAYRHVMEEDLRQIQRHFPEENIGRLEELGEEYFTLRENGMDPVLACAAVLQLRKGKNKPPETGLVTLQTAGPKEYYTPGEVDRLTGEQLRDPGVMAAVRYSMTRWKHR